jgi:hypothetical protein
VTVETKQTAGALGTAHSRGTATALSPAHAEGTAKKNNPLKLIDSTISNAYANGTDWTVGKHEKALVNELGPNKPESYVHNGVWSIFAGGP